MLEDGTISAVDITIDVPRTDERPDYTAEFPLGAHYYSADFANTYYLNDVRWEDVTTGSTLKQDTDVFQTGHVYSVFVYLTADEGYVFVGWTDADGAIVSEEALFVPALADLAEGRVHRGVLLAVGNDLGHAAARHHQDQRGDDGLQFELAHQHAVERAHQQADHQRHDHHEYEVEE